MRKLARGLLDLVLPPVCGACGRGVAGALPLCPSCDRQLPRWRGNAPTPPGLIACVAELAYDGDVVHWLRRFKYPRFGLSGLDPAATGLLRAVACEAARRAPGPAPELIVPIALHPRRLRQRGFNPAAVLARAVAQAIGAPWTAACLVRVRDTRSQTGLGRAERQRNLRGAFRVRPGLRLPERIWLVDDVATTGSTLAEAARALRRAGAREVTGVCAARTP